MMFMMRSSQTSVSMTSWWLRGGLLSQIQVLLTKMVKLCSEICNIKNSQNIYHLFDKRILSGLCLLTHWHHQRFSVLWRRRESSVGRYASCKKLAINRSIGDRLEKVISGHSLLGLTVLTLRCLLRDTQTDEALERKEVYKRIRVIGSYCRIA